MNKIGADALQIATNVIDKISSAKASRATAAATTTNATGATQAGGSDKNTFMRLLVEQLKHQDPLAPQDGAQFVAQLAQFNSLEQLIGINQQLGQLLAQGHQTTTTTTPTTATED